MIRTVYAVALQGFDATGATRSRYRRRRVPRRQRRRIPDAEGVEGREWGEGISLPAGSGAKTIFVLSIKRQRTPLVADLTRFQMTFCTELNVDMS